MAQQRKRWVGLADVKCTKETAAALLCQVEDKEVWIPKSQLAKNSEVQQDGDLGTLVIPAWLATEKELI